ASSELAAAPASVEQRVRRIPGPGGVGIARQETIDFPLWYLPGQAAGGSIDQAAGLATRILAEAGDDSSGKRPLLIHVCGRLPAAASLRAPSVRYLLDISVWLNLHLGTTDRIPATMYPSSSRYLVGDDLAALFEASSELPDSMAATVRGAGVPLASRARGLIHQATMGDLIRLLGLAKAYVAAPAGNLRPADRPPSPLPVSLPEVAAVAAAPAISPEPPAPGHSYDRVAIFLLADRAQVDPGSGSWDRRQDQVNDLLDRVSRRAGGDCEVGLVVYGDGSIEVGFPGPFEDRATVADLDLPAAALRVERVREKASNGIGGLIEVQRDRPVFIDRQPAPRRGRFESAVAALAPFILQVCQARQGQEILPLVLHVTGAGLPPDAVAAAAAQLADLGPLLFYHAVLPECPQPVVAYPSDPAQIADPEIAALWPLTSPLAGADRIASKRRTVTPASRGIVVGGRFDLLLESIRAILGKEL
ncbi:MAG: hypothetical protein ACYC6Y_12880, partial [Thermoguttaceae bacterium]